MSEHKGLRPCPGYSNNLQHKFQQHGHAQTVLQENISLLKNTLLAELLKIDSVEDYYAFAIKHDSLLMGTQYFPPIPFPSLSAFFLCIHVGKIREAGAVYTALLHQHNEAIFNINACMRPESTKEIHEKFDRLDYPNTMHGGAERWLAEIEIVCNLLRERQELLKDEVSKRIERSRNVCDWFLADRLSFPLDT